MGSRSEINRICGIIDLSGDQVGSYFHVRELAMISLDRNVSRPVSKFYDYKPYGLNMFLHPNRRPIVPEVYHISQVDDHIKSLCEQMKKPGKDVLSYKGGQCEQERLAALNIPHCNLEDFGCPRYEQIRSRDHIRQGCRWHKFKRGHCPRSEVLSFKAWLLNRQRQM